jgi:short-subunit dehydrogenase
MNIKTGASMGIGEAVALALASVGANLVLLSRSKVCSLSTLLFVSPKL